MALPRSALVARHATPGYHLVNRCVRRAFAASYAGPMPQAGSALIIGLAGSPIACISWRVSSP
jgi:hypothetical protein